MPSTKKLQADNRICLQIQQTDTQTESGAWKSCTETVVVTRTVDVGARRRRVAQQRAPHVDPICVQAAIAAATCVFSAASDLLALDLVVRTKPDHSHG